MWATFYVVFTALVITGLYAAGSHIRTHTLPVGQIELSVPYSTYLVGETVTFTVKNNFNSPIYIANACPAEPLNVYRLENGRWQRTHDTALKKDCPEEDRQIKIPANGSVSSSFAPWHDLFKTPGKYRVVAYVEYYNSLPYQEFEIITAPVSKPPIVITLPGPSVGNTIPLSPQQTSGTVQGSPSTPAGSTGSTPQPNPNPQAYTIHVNSSGNYDTTNLTAKVGDSLTLVYSAPYGNEVRTRFSPVSPTTAAIASVTVDGEYKSRTITLSAKGTWTFKADDHSGNSGTLTVQ
jgi:plastocyanin